MTVLTLTRRISSPKEGLLANQIRTFIAEHLGVDVDSIGVDSHFRDDLGLDLLDVVELMILLEEKFTNGKITDEGDGIEFVGDLIRHIEV
jgi:acyl carrier protein